MQNQIQKAYDAQKRIAEIINERDSYAKELSKIMEERKARREESKRMNMELHQLLLAVSGKSLEPKIKIEEKIKWRTKKVVETRNVIKEKIKWKTRKIIENKEGMQKFLKEIDDLLSKLPKEEIDSFAKSKDFGVYKKIMNKYGVK